MNWSSYYTWSAWIVGGRYITCLADRRDMTGVMEAVQEKATELGTFVDNNPIVLISVNFLGGQEYDYLIGQDEGKITLILE